jgi:hypothetical protein
MAYNSPHVLWKFLFYLDLLAGFWAEVGQNLSDFYLFVKVLYAPIYKPNIPLPS